MSLEPLFSFELKMLTNMYQTEHASSFVTHSTQVLVGALTRPEMSVNKDDCIHLVFARHLLECLLLCLSGAYHRSGILLLKC